MAEMRVESVFDIVFLFVDPPKVRTLSTNPTLLTKKIAKKKRFPATARLSDPYFFARLFEIHTKNAFNVGNLKTPKRSSCAISKR